MMGSSNVLVLGGAGYIGGKVCDRLQETGLVPYVYDSLLYEERYLKPCNFVYGDIRDKAKLKRALKAKDFDSVVLLAAIVGDPACNVNQKLTEEVNYKAVRDICKLIPKDIHVVFASTCSVYGSNHNFVDEESPTNPLSSYASTKLRAEKHVTERGGTVFRLGTVFGMGDTYSRIRADLVVNTLTIKAHVEGEITVNGGDQWRPIISVHDIAGYMVEACQKKIAGTYNIAFKNVKIKDLANDIKIVFPDVKVNTIDQSYQDARNYKVLTTWAQEHFRFQPEVPPLAEIKKMAVLLRGGRIKDPYNVNYNNGLFLATRRI